MHYYNIHYEYLYNALYLMRRWKLKIS